MKDEAMVVRFPQCLPDSGIHEDSLIECLIAVLFGNIDRIVQLLPLKDGMQVVEKDAQVLPSISVWDDDGNPMSWIA